MIRRMIPPMLQEQLDENGYVTLRQFAEANHVGYGTVLGFVRAGTLPAVDVRAEGSGRASYRVLEDGIHEFYEQRAVQAKAGVDMRARRRHQQREPVRDFLAK